MRNTVSKLPVHSSGISSSYKKSRANAGNLCTITSSVRVSRCSSGIKEYFLLWPQFSAANGSKSEDDK